MAIFIAITGPAATGKTSLINSLSTHQELSKCLFSPDFHEVVWAEIVDKKTFTDYTDLTSDSTYLCAYIHKVVDYYNEYIENLEDYDGIVFLDGSWVDFTVYSLIWMWYNRVISSAQEEVFTKILKHVDKISRYYMTRADDYKYPIDKYRVRGRHYTFKKNRPMEIALYKIFSKREGLVNLPAAEISGDSIAILEDMRKVGYL